MNLLTLKAKLSKAQYTALARKAGTSAGYLDQIAGAHRKPSARLAKRLVAADARLTLESLRPDIYERAA